MPPNFKTFIKSSDLVIDKDFSLRLSRACGLQSAIGSYDDNYSLAGSGHGGCSDSEHRSPFVVRHNASVHDFYGKSYNHFLSIEGVNIQFINQTFLFDKFILIPDLSHPHTLSSFYQILPAGLNRHNTLTGRRNVLLEHNYANSGSCEGIRNQIYHSAGTVSSDSVGEADRAGTD